MASRAPTVVIFFGIGASLCACASINGSVNSASGAVGSGAGAVYHGGAAVYQTSSSMVGTTVGETYNGLGGAVRRPFQDFNLMQDKVPDQLEQALKNPYETNDLTSCEKINARVAALDIVLGPDLDTPTVEDQRDRWHKGASSAADYALAAATDAADHFIPVRGMIRQISGASKTEKHAKRALLAGSVRRGFLKAVGMQQGCGWPAAPVDFDPLLSIVHRQHAGLPAGPALTPALTGGLKPGTQAPTVPALIAGSATVPLVIASASQIAPPIVAPTISPVVAPAAPPARSQDYGQAQVRVAQRAFGPPASARRGVVERAPVGQSVVLPPRARSSQTS